MIIGPKNWHRVGNLIDLSEIEFVIINILKKIKCKNLALSGGIDSTLMLSLMIKAFAATEIKCFNIALSEDHPDYIFSEIAARFFKVGLEHFVPYGKLLKKKSDFSGDEIVREFYNCLKRRRVESVIACDGIDEFNAGYYDHMKSPTEETYYDFIRRFQTEQLIPLNKNSGKIKIHLPYIFDEVLFCWMQIPLFEKIDKLNRKKVVYKLAERNDVPEEIINRRKYGFCDAMIIKDNLYES